MVKVKVNKIHSEAKTPKMSSKNAACFDVFTCEDFIISKNKFVKARTGLRFEIPRGFFIEVRMRSGMASRGIIIPNAPATIDSDYRGEILIPLYGLFCKQEFFGVGSKIAQCRVVKCYNSTFKEKEELSDTERGDSGFGSTGK